MLPCRKAAEERAPEEQTAWKPMAPREEPHKQLGSQAKNNRKLAAAPLLAAALAWRTGVIFSKEPVADVT